MTVACPQCGKDVIWDELSPWRPFCSKRCQLIDLGVPPGRTRSTLLLLFSTCGILFLVLEGHAIGFSGWNWLWLE
ncbi:DNA gyrase inhibitor YacG, partial [Pantoea agglomerans]|uniref:DNA gyrase inhibitor YacG n=1 Tax=Enterobacter agglomerans TaxID=549 RepID=UPI003F6E31B0